MKIWGYLDLASTQVFLSTYSYQAIALAWGGDALALHAMFQKLSVTLMTRYPEFNLLALSVLTYELAYAFKNSIE